MVRGIKRGPGLILLLGLLEAFGPLSMDLYMPSLPELAQSLGTTDALAQMTMAVCMIGLGLGQLVAGPLSDRYGRRKPLLIGVVAFTVLSVACALAPTIEWLLVFRAFQGVGGSAGMVITLAIARDLYSGIELSKMLSWLALVAAISPIIAPLLGGQLALFMDWRGIFLVLGGLGAALFAAAFFGLAETHLLERRSSDGRAILRDARVLLRPGIFLSILVISAISGIAFFAYLSMSSFVLQNGFGLSPQLFALLFASGSVCNVIGSQTNRVLVGRFSPLQLYRTGLVIAFSGGLIAAVSALYSLGLVSFLIGLGLYLVSTGFALPNQNTLALDHHGERAGSAAALLGTASMVVGPIVAPIVSIGGVTAQALGVTMVAASVIVLIIGLTTLRSPRSPLA